MHIKPKRTSVSSGMSFLGRLCGWNDEPVPGLLIAKNAISETEEAAILEALDSDTTDWTLRSSRVTRNYGYFYTYRKTQGHRFPTEKTVRFLPVPRWACRYLAKRVVDLFKLPNDWNVNQVHVSLYRRKEKHRIRQHNDCDMGELRHAVVGISLGDHAIMTFESPNGERKLIRLPRRSAYAMTEDSLRFWRHGIRPEHNTGTRLSITLRHVDQLYLDSPRKNGIIHVQSLESVASTANASTTTQNEISSEVPSQEHLLRSEQSESVLVQQQDETTIKTNSSPNVPIVHLRKEIVVNAPQEEVDALVAQYRFDTATENVPKLHHHQHDQHQ